MPRIDRPDELLLAMRRGGNVLRGEGTEGQRVSAVRTCIAEHAELCAEFAEKVSEWNHRLRQTL